MAQQINFAPFPGTVPLSYVAVVREMLSWMDLEAPGARGVREWLRGRELFDKEGYETLLDMVDVRSGEPVVLGSIAREILDAQGESDVRAILARTLVSRNPLLAKYCIEALDTDRGGRLHSTNELYRLVTSYVYPGIKPTLPSFRAWVDWAAAVGLVKVVGIRWALGERGIDVLPRLRAIDAEEFLDEERTAAATAGVEEQDCSPGDAAPHPSPGDAVQSSPPGEAAPSHQEAAPPAQPVEAAPPASRSAAAGRPPPPERPAPRHDGGPGTGPGRTRDLLLAWWSDYPGRRAFQLADLGISWPAQADVLPVEAAFAALLSARGLSPDVIRNLFQAFREKGVLADASRGRLTLDKIGTLMSSNPGGEFRRGCEAVVHMQRLQAGVSQPGLLDHGDPRALANSLWGALFSPHDPMAPFLLARLLHDEGRLAPGLTAAAFLPWFAVRESAFRIGFVDRLYAPAFGDLLEACMALSPLFGSPAFEGPLAQAPEGFGCSFGCGRTAVCLLDCRERSEAAPARFQ